MLDDWIFNHFDKPKITVFHINRIFYDGFYRGSRVSSVSQTSNLFISHHLSRDFDWKNVRCYFRFLGWCWNQFIKKTTNIWKTNISVARAIDMRCFWLAHFDFENNLKWRELFLYEIFVKVKFEQIKFYVLDVSS